MFLAACSGGNNEDEATPDNDSDATGSELAENQEITVLESAEIPSMDSVLAEDTVGFTMINNVNEGLYRLDQE
jgi:oligopeptide transport system substrate-binding protein